MSVENTYAIVWLARHRESSGVGTKRFSKEEAEKVARELNEDHPAFAHRAVDIAVENVAQAIESLRAALKQPQSITYPDLYAVAAEAFATEPPQPPQEQSPLSVTGAPKTLQAA